MMSVLGFTGCVQRCCDFEDATYVEVLPTYGAIESPGKEDTEIAAAAVYVPCPNDAGGLNKELQTGQLSPCANQLVELGTDRDNTRAFKLQTNQMDALTMEKAYASTYEPAPRSQARAQDGDCAEPELSVESPLPSA